MRGLTLFAALIVAGALAGGVRGSEVAVKNGRLFFTSAGAVFSINPDGSGRKQVTKPGESRPGFPERDSSPIVSRDGTRLAFLRCQSSSSGTCAIWTAGLDGSAARRIVEGPSGGFRGLEGWSPAPPRIAFVQCANAQFDAACALRTVNADGSANRAIVTQTGTMHAEWAPDGKRLLVWKPGSISVVNADGSGLSVLVNKGSQPVWSPDGARIAYVTTDGAGQHSAIWAMNADGSASRQLSPSGLPLEVMAEWSPDGRRVAYIEANSNSIFQHEAGVGVVNADGSAQQTLVPRGPYNAYAVHWAPDGTALAFVGTSGPGSKPAGIFALASTGGSVRTLAANDPAGGELFHFDWARAAPPAVKPKPKPPFCKKGQKPTKKKPCRKRK